LHSLVWGGKGKGRNFRVPPLGVLPDQRQVGEAVRIDDEKWKVPKKKMSWNGRLVLGKTGAIVSKGTGKARIKGCDGARQTQCLGKNEQCRKTEEKINRIFRKGGMGGVVT